MCPKVNAHRLNFIERMTSSESMSDGHLGCLNVYKRDIKVPLGASRPVHCSTYRAGPGASQCEK